MNLHEHTYYSGHTYFCRVQDDISTAVGSLPPAPYRESMIPCLIQDIVHLCHAEGIKIKCSLGAFSSSDMPDESTGTRITRHNGPDSCTITRCKSYSGRITWSKCTHNGTSRHEFLNGGRGSWCVAECNNAD